jgi:glycosyltransferase involved in cell wall biosynthesis
MKILQVIDRLNIGGAERVMVDLSNLLHEHKENVSVMFLLYPGPMADMLHTDIPKFVLHRKQKFSLLSLYRCASHLKKFDIIHCHHQYVFNYIKLACILFRVSTPIILHDHGPNREYSIKTLPVSLLFKPQFYIGVSTQLIEWAKHQFSLKDTNSFLLHNIIRKKHKIASSKKYDLILLSNIKPEKNQLLAVAIANIMRCKLLIVGNIQDNDYYEKIKQASDHSCIHFITDCKDATPYIAEARIGLHTSSSETGPLVLLEYMATGIPFLSFETGEVARICKNNFPDFFISTLSPSDWSSKISEIQKTFTTDHSSQLLSFFDQHFNEHSYLKKCLTIYNHISQNC